MAKHEFRFIVSDVDLDPGQHERISRTVAQAAALALAEVTPVNAVSVQLRPNVWWRGIPPEAAVGLIETRAREETGA
jgi:hypothetical protein